MGDVWAPPAKYKVPSVFTKGGQKYSNMVSSSTARFFSFPSEMWWGVLYLSRGGEEEDEEWWLTTVQRTHPNTEPGFLKVLKGSWAGVSERKYQKKKCERDGKRGNFEWGEWDKRGKKRKRLIEKEMVVEGKVRGRRRKEGRKEIKGKKQWIEKKR